jgi:hypothetical protein
MAPRRAVTAYSRASRSRYAGGTTTRGGGPPKVTAPSMSNRRDWRAARRHASCFQRAEEIDDMKIKLAPYAENMCESGIACLLTMVQGNVLALGLSHWIIASQTGLIAGAIVGTTVIAASLRRPWVVSLALGCVTMVVDFFVHPSTLRIGSLLEPIVSGVGAFVLSLAVSDAFRHWRVWRRPAQEM